MAPTIPLLILSILLINVLYAEEVSKSQRIVWTGAVTESSFTVTFEGAPDEKFIISPSNSSTSDKLPKTHNAKNLAILPIVITKDHITYSSGQNSFVKLNVTGLKPDTNFMYSVVPGGQRVRNAVPLGFIRTFPVPLAPTNFTFAVGSCAKWPDQAYAFEHMLKQSDVRFFVHSGDFFYGDIAQNNRQLFVDQYLSVLGAGVQRRLFKQMPLFYIYDDHDFGPNNADGTSPSRDASLWAFSSLYPHYPLRTVKNDIVGFQAFTVGSVRMIMTDLRSQSKYDFWDPKKSTNLGSEQLQWLLEEFEDFKKYKMMVWVSSKPWNGENSTMADQWRGFYHERALIANKIAELKMDNLIMIAGDAHMLAIDDGTNTDYSTGNDGNSTGAGFPILQSAPLANYGSVKGGLYSEGCHGYKLSPNYQYSTVKITDSHDSGSVCFEFRGYSVLDNPDEPVLKFKSCRDDKKTWMKKRDSSITQTKECSMPWFRWWS
ncbi:PhoD-like phosphatase-domain-containing protein [Paraphysoderma sedebokerense]|nr:PhoD-like phosphatase-domain-containing protein [Paraphysoderma sedebokerense]